MIFPCPTTPHYMLLIILQSHHTQGLLSVTLLDNICVTCSLRADPLTMLGILTGAPAWTTTPATNPYPLGGVWCPYWLLIILSLSAPCISFQHSLNLIKFPFMDPIYPSCLPSSINIIDSHAPSLRQFDPHMSTLIQTFPSGNSYPPSPLGLLVLLWYHTYSVG